MNILLQIVVLIIGFVILIKGADTLVDGASSIAKNLKIPDILVGLTIVAFGTSAPEAAVSIKAMLSNNSDMLLGNVIGSNILNILLIVGVSAFIFPLCVKTTTIKKEIPFTFLVSLLLLVMYADIPLQNGVANGISRSEGVVILLFFVVFLYHLISLAKKEKGETVEAKYKMGLAALFTILGLGAIIIGGNLVVEAATSIAVGLGVSQSFISLTIVAIGTSLPELVTSVSAARKQEQDIAVGNIIGSNIFNICFVIGLPAAIFGNIIPTDLLYTDLIIMVIAVILLFFFSKSEKKVTRKEGIILFALFIAYYGYLIMNQLLR